MKRQDELHSGTDAIEQMHLSFHLSGQAKECGSSSAEDEHDPGYFARLTRPTKAVKAFNKCNLWATPESIQIAHFALSLDRVSIEKPPAVHRAPKWVPAHQQPWAKQQQVVPIRKSINYNAQEIS
ncbi:hypothetical protein EAH_00068490 [Eimeria acervulina]|uniref:Uncharacterized protein n=1 Tax=Eimeria acervulina TaxID=5801 RepID=U6GSG7_EIMAC|nr:hypothetical protein EAH_00068490 [Eimeria acervulina]CDI83120.1 hypothetical protein EAH_00068490 [Eimeria acervulina]